VLDHCADMLCEWNLCKQKTKPISKTQNMGRRSTSLIPFTALLTRRLLLIYTLWKKCCSYDMQCTRVVDTRTLGSLSLIGRFFSRSKCFSASSSKIRWTL
jgi:hypothetical protein